MNTYDGVTVGFNVTEVNGGALMLGFMLDVTEFSFEPVPANPVYWVNQFLPNLR